MGVRLGWGGAAAAEIIPVPIREYTGYGLRMLALLLFSACRRDEVVPPAHPSLAGCTWEEWAEYADGPDLYTRYDYDQQERVVHSEYLSPSHDDRFDYTWEGDCQTGYAAERSAPEDATNLISGSVTCDSAGWSTWEAYRTEFPRDDGEVISPRDHFRDYENTFGVGAEIATRRYDATADGNWDRTWVYAWWNGRLVARDELDSDGDWSGTERWTYDPAGEVVLYEDNYAAGRSIFDATTRDDLGRVRTVSHYAENAHIFESFTTFLYDGDALYPVGWEQDEGYKGIDGEVDHRAEISVSCG